MPPFSPNALLPLLAALPPSARLWIAFSGGRDSHCLLDACARLWAERRSPPGLALAAIHVDHGLHGQSAAWAGHCRRVCAGLGVPLTERQVTVPREPGDSLEAAARTARHDAFAEVIGAGDLLATAHHQDDQAETLLLALLRGSGVHGLAAMPARSPFGRGWLVRPLLGFGRQALAAYAAGRGLVSIDDPSNADLARDRNRLRHEVLPLLRRRWPAASATLARSAALCAEAAALVDADADARLPALAGSRPGTLSARGLRATEPVLARALLRRWIAVAGFRPPPAARLGQVIDRLLTARADADPRVSWAGCELRRYRDDLFALTPLPPRPTGTRDWDGTPLPLPAGLGTLRIEGDGDIALKRLVSFDRAGLRCAGAAGQPSHALKNCFQQAGIPPWLRPYVPLVLADDGRLLAIAGVCGCGDTPLPVRWEGHPWQHLGIFQGPGTAAVAGR